MKKRIGWILVRVVDVKPGWIDAVVVASNAPVTFILTRDNEKLTQAMLAIKEKQKLVSFKCIKDDDPGFYTFLAYSIKRGLSIKSKTNRLKAEAEMRELLRTSLNEVKGKGRQKKMRNRDALKKDVLQSELRRVIGGSIAKPKTELITSGFDFLP